MGECIDIAVIGGGIAGCFAAWRLQRARPGESPLIDALRRENPTGPLVCLFEASDRIGGRLYSYRHPELPDVPIELGGTGLYLPSKDNRRFLGHWRMAQLLDHLKIERVPFEPGNSLNPHYLRETHFCQGDFGDKARGLPFNRDAVPFDLAKEHTYLDDVLADAFNMICPGATRYSEATLEIVQRTAQFLGRPLHEWSMGDALAAVLSEEALAFLRHTTPLRSTITIANLADGMMSFLRNEFAGFVPYYMKGGNDTVCKELVKELGGAARTCCRLVKIERTDGKFTLHFKDRECLRARHVVLALPQQPLRELLGQSELFSGEDKRQLEDDLAAVRAVPAYIAFQIYPYPFWRRTATVAGICFIDSWSREVWIRQTRGEQLGREDARDDQRSLIMHAWRDELDIVKLTDVVKLRSRGLASVDGAAIFSKMTKEDTAELDTALTEELRKLFRLDYAPTVIGSIAHHWGRNNEAFHIWLPGRRSWEIAARMLQPSASLPLYICGEAYSENQGWMEGAMATTVEMLKKLGLRDPLDFT